jgi:hypothetical protein
MNSSTDSACSLRKPSSAGRKNASPAYRPQNAAWGPPSPRAVAGLRRVFRAIATASFDGFHREQADSVVPFRNNPGVGLRYGMKPTAGSRLVYEVPVTSPKLADLGRAQVGPHEKRRLSG